MIDINKVILVGRLGRDPVLRETHRGYPVAHFSLATQSMRKPRQENDSETPATDPANSRFTEWHQIVAWGKQAENSVQYLKKGSAVYLEGTLKSRRYTARDGKEQTSFEVHADQISYLSAPGERNRQPSLIGAE